MSRLLIDENIMDAFDSEIAVLEERIRTNSDDEVLRREDSDRLAAAKYWKEKVLSIPAIEMQKIASGLVASDSVKTIEGEINSFISQVEESCEK